jgi:hypothetical protein
VKSKGSLLKVTVVLRLGPVVKFTAFFTSTRRRYNVLLLGACGPTEYFL